MAQNSPVRIIGVTVLLLMTATIVNNVAFAGIILDSGPGGVPVNNAPNNDDFTGSGSNNPNQLGIAAPFQTSNPIDVVNFVANSGGITEYYTTIVPRNFTATDSWHNFSVFIGYGTGSEFLWTTDSFGLSFDYEPDADLSAVPPTDPFNFSALGRGSYLVTGAPLPVLAPDTIFSLSVSLDVPDSSSIPSSARVYQPVTNELLGYEFTLRLQPSTSNAIVLPRKISEPNTLALVALVLMGIPLVRVCGT